MPKNDERTQFEYKDHDPTRYAVESIIAFVTLKFVPETKVFRLDAATVEALNVAVKHHDDMGTPVESTLKKPGDAQAGAQVEKTGCARDGVEETKICASFKRRRR